MPTRPIFEVDTARADSNVSGSSLLRKCGAVSGVMNGLSTMKTRSNFAASARRAFSMYQPMSMLASPARSGSRQDPWSAPTPSRMAPSFSWRTAASAMGVSSLVRARTLATSPLGEKKRGLLIGILPAMMAEPGS